MLLYMCFCALWAYMVPSEARRGYGNPLELELQRVVSLHGMPGSEPGFSARAEPSHLSSLLLLWFCFPRHVLTRSYYVAQAVLLSTVECHQVRSSCLL